MSDTTDIQKKLHQRGIDLVINNNTWITTKDIYCNDDIYLFQKYMIDKKIFWINHEGKTLFPTYMFDSKNQPLPIIAELMKIYSKRSFWSLAMWLESINSYFNAKSPKDFLISEPDKVLEAARDSLQPPQHG